MSPRLRFLWDLTFVIRIREFWASMFLRVIRSPWPLSIMPYNPSEINSRYLFVWNRPTSRYRPVATVSIHSFFLKHASWLFLRKLNRWFHSLNEPCSISLVITNSEDIEPVVFRVSHHFEINCLPWQQTKLVSESLNTWISIAINVPPSRAISFQAILSNDLVLGVLAVCFGNYSWHGHQFREQNL